MTVLPGVLRVDAIYRLGEGGCLAAELPIKKVPVRDEGALYSRLARLVDAPDAVIVEAATRYGPLGPVGPLAIPDRPGFLLTASRQMRNILDRIPKLHRWIATGGTSAVKGRDVLTAYAIAAYAEADPKMAAELVAALSGDRQALTREDRTRLLTYCDVLEEVCLTALSRHVAAILDHAEHPDRVTLVRPTAQAARRLPEGARLFRLLATTADEIGPASELLSPNRLGSLGTELAPYFPDGNIIPADTIEAWRTAARLLAVWTRLARHRSLLSIRQRRELRDALAAHLQRIDAWPLPTGEALGTYPRALWSLWPIFGDSRPQRACASPNCSALLPPDAHANRQLCDDHRREADRLRARRNRDHRHSALGAGAPVSTL